MEQHLEPYAPCPRCPGANAVRLRNTGSPVFRCPRCGLIFSPATPSPFSVRLVPEVEGHGPQLRDETKNPKLDSYERETKETASAPEKRCASYDVDLPESPQSAPDRPLNHVPQLRRKTAKSKLNSYERETNETRNSYEKQNFSYDCCLTPICKSLQTRPQNHVPQLRLETRNPKLNTYDRKTIDTRPPFHASEVTR